jgi:hypothetical protein
LEKDHFFTKVETNNGRLLYLFMSFEGHQTDDKTAFPVGTLTLYKSDLATTPIYTAQCKEDRHAITLIVNSMDCYNREIEWNYAYFKKIRLCFSLNQRKLKDVKFDFKEGDELSPKVFNCLHAIFYSSGCISRCSSRLTCWRSPWGTSRRPLSMTRRLRWLRT